MSNFVKPNSALNFLYVDILDENECYEIKNRKIIPPTTPTELVQTESNSQMITFTTDRYQEGIDLSTKQINIVYSNAIHKKHTDTAVNVYVNEDTLKFSWLITRNASMYAGYVNFKIEFLDNKSNTDKTDDYALVTANCKLKVNESVNFNHASTSEQDYWYADLLGKVGATVDHIEQTFVEQSTDLRNHISSLFLSDDNVYLTNLQVWYETQYIAGSSEYASFKIKPNLTIVCPNGHIIHPKNTGTIFSVSTNITLSGPEDQPEYVYDFYYSYYNHLGEQTSGSTFVMKYLALIQKSDGWYVGFCDDDTKSNSILLMEIYNDAPYGLGISNKLIDLKYMNLSKKLQNPPLYVQENTPEHPQEHDLWIW